MFHLRLAILTFIFIYIVPVFRIVILITLFTVLFIISHHIHANVAYYSIRGYALLLLLAIDCNCMLLCWLSKTDSNCQLTLSQLSAAQKPRATTPSQICSLLTWSDCWFFHWWLATASFLSNIFPAYLINCRAHTHTNVMKCEM